MKNKHSITRWLLAAVLPALFLSSCSKDNDVTDYPVTPEPSGGDIRFEIGFATQGGGAMNASTDGSDVPLTRVATDALFNSTWEDGDEIGVFAVKAGEPLAASGNYIHNAKLTYSSANGGTWTQAEPLYWPTNAYGKLLDFYAYYPYDASATDPTNIAFSVQADQSGTTDGKSNYSLSDLLTAKAAGVSKGTDGKVSLTFSHALAMVQVAIPGGKGWGASKGLTVTLRDVKIKSTLDLGAAAGSEVVPGSSDNATVNVTMHLVEQPTDANYATSYTYRALVPAQEIAQGKSLFFFDHEGRQLFTDGALSSPLAMTAGQAEKFERTLPIVETGTKIPAGTFQMGSPGTEPDRVAYLELQHSVTLTKDFYMSKYEVTNSQYVAFLNAAGIGSKGEGSVTYDDNGSSTTVTQPFITVFALYRLRWDGDKWVPVAGYGDHPVYVNWYGAKAFADYYGYSLPTEAQWEYACRGGQTESLPFGIGTGRKLTADMANFKATFPYDLDNNHKGSYEDNNWSSSYVAGTTIVGTYSYANGYDLYDMHGNLREWCLDQLDYGNYDSESVTDPVGTTGSERVLRGGFWFVEARNCRSAYRYFAGPKDSYDQAGFRVVVVP